MGWMTRVHPLQLPSGRILVPLYSDGYSFSLIAISDDSGASWTTSEPWSVRGTFSRRWSGSARDSKVGVHARQRPGTQTVPMSVSHDMGSPGRGWTDTDIPNPGTSLKLLACETELVLMYNDLERSRHSLANLLGRTTKARRGNGRVTWISDLRGEGAGSFHYPVVCRRMTDHSRHLQLLFESLAQGIAVPDHQARAFQRRVDQGGRLNETGVHRRCGIA